MFSPKIAQKRNTLVDPKKKPILQAPSTLSSNKGAGNKRTLPTKTASTKDLQKSDYTHLEKKKPTTFQANTPKNNVEKKFFSRTNSMKNFIDEGKLNMT